MSMSLLKTGVVCCGVASVSRPDVAPNADFKIFASHAAWTSCHYSFTTICPSPSSSASTLAKLPNFNQSGRSPSRPPWSAFTTVSSPRCPACSQFKVYRKLITPLQPVNPFAKRDEHSKNTIVTYKVLTVVTWLLSVIVSFEYTINDPQDGPYHRRSIWRQNDHYLTAFRMNHIITTIYW